MTMSRNLANVLEIEPNNAAGEATPANLQQALNENAARGVALHGVIGGPGDYDHFRFTAKKGQVLDVQVYARRLAQRLPVMDYVRSEGIGYIADYDGPLLDEGSDSNIVDYCTTMERLLTLPVTVVHGGHDPSFGRDRMYEIARSYLQRRS